MKQYRQPCSRSGIMRPFQSRSESRTSGSPASLLSLRMRRILPKSSSRWKIAVPQNTIALGFRTTAIRSSWNWAKAVFGCEKRLFDTCLLPHFERGLVYLDISPFLDANQHSLGGRLRIHYTFDSCERPNRDPHALSRKQLKQRSVVPMLEDSSTLVVHCHLCGLRLPRINHVR